MTLLDPVPTVTRKGRLATLPVAIIGAGPVGLAAAAHLAERGIDFVVWEAGADAGASIREWGHIRLFSPWKHLVDAAARRLLESHGWEPPGPDLAPTGAQLVEQYIVPLAATEQIAARLRTGALVIGVTREGMDRTRTTGRSATPFTLRFRTADGRVEDVAARAVIDASGTYRSANSLASDGLELRGMAQIADLVTPALPDVLGRDRARFAGRHTTVVGAGHAGPVTGSSWPGDGTARRSCTPLFLVGMKSYGRAPTFLLATGYEQVRSVTAWLAGDAASASHVQLILPATGVCSTGPDGAGGCCS